MRCFCSARFCREKKDTYLVRMTLNEILNSNLECVQFYTMCVQVYLGILNLFSNTCWKYSGCCIFFSNTKFSTCMNFFNIFLLVFCEHFRMGTHFVLKNVYQIQNFRYFLPVPHVRHAIRLTSAKANTQQQTCSHACSQS